MREGIRMVVVLTVIAAISAMALSYVYSYTIEIIEENAARALQESIFDVLPQAREVQFLSLEGGVIFEGFDASKTPVGYAFVGEGQGYGGVVKVLIGLDMTHQIVGVKVVEHAETPGLGTAIEAESFRRQFLGLGKEDRIALRQDIDNISGATVSANAMVEAVRSGLDWAIPAYEGGR